jgi:hypothetical protein
MRVVVAWATAVREGGRVPLYRTEWGNTASRALARRLGLICYAEDLHLLTIRTSASRHDARTRRRARRWSRLGDPSQSANVCRIHHRR